MDNDTEHASVRLSDISRELGHELLSISVLVARARRGDPEQPMIQEIDRAVTHSMALARELSSRLEAKERRPRAGASAGDDDERSSVRIEVRGVADDMHARVAEVLRGVVSAFGGEVEIQAQPRLGAAVVIRLARST